MTAKRLGTYQEEPKHYPTRESILRRREQLEAEARQGKQGVARKLERLQAGVLLLDAGITKAAWDDLDRVQERIIDVKINGNRASGKVERQMMRDIGRIGKMAGDLAGRLSTKRPGADAEPEEKTRGRMKIGQSRWIMGAFLSGHPEPPEKSVTPADVKAWRAQVGHCRKIELDAMGKGNGPVMVSASVEEAVRLLAGIAAACGAIPAMHGWDVEGCKRKARGRPAGWSQSDTITAVVEWGQRWQAAGGLECGLRGEDLEPGPVLPGERPSFLDVVEAGLRWIGHSPARSAIRTQITRPRKKI